MIWASGARRRRLAAACAVLSLGFGGLAFAAELAPDVQAELKRAVAAVGPSSSEEPALREERKTREPSPGFLLGAALGAWTNAAAQLDFDLKNPGGVGPPHAHLGEDDFILQDCREEKAAFDRLESRAKALGLGPEAVAGAAGQGGVLAVWRARQAGPAKAC